MIAALTPLSSPIAHPGLALASPSASLARLGLSSVADPLIGQIALLNTLLLGQLALLMEGRPAGNQAGPPASTDAGGDRSDGGPSPASSGSGSQVAQEVAREMAGYKYQFYYNDRKSEAETERSRSGNCKDLADVAIAKFRQRGVQARLVHGNIQSKSYTGGHYWIEFQDSSGKWQFFDPTGAATNHSAQRAFQGLHASYKKS